MNWKRSSDAQALNELGHRLKAERLRKKYTQQELASKAGITTYTLQKMEAGHSSSMKTLIRVLRAMNEIEQLEHLLPRVEISPLKLLEDEKRPQRIRRPKKSGGS